MADPSSEGGGDAMHRFLAFHCNFTSKDGIPCGRQIEHGWVTACGHVFCYEHAKEWFEAHDDCAICRDGPVKLVKMDFSTGTVRRRMKMALLGMSPLDIMQALDIALNFWIDQKAFEYQQKFKRLEDLRRRETGVQDMLKAKLQDLDGNCVRLQDEQQQLERRLEEVGQASNRAADMLQRAKRGLAETEDKYSSLHRQLSTDPRRELRDPGLRGGGSSAGRGGAGGGGDGRILLAGGPSPAAAGAAGAGVGGGHHRRGASLGGGGLSLGGGGGGVSDRPSLGGAGSFLGGGSGRRDSELLGAQLFTGPRPSPGLRGGSGQRGASGGGGGGSGFRGAGAGASRGGAAAELSALDFSGRRSGGRDAAAAGEHRAAAAANPLRRKREEALNSFDEIGAGFRGVASTSGRKAPPATITPGLLGGGGRFTRRRIT